MIIEDAQLKNYKLLSCNHVFFFFFFFFFFNFQIFFFLNVLFVCMFVYNVLE